VRGRRGCESVLEAPTEAAKAASAFVRINTFTGATAFKVFWLKALRAIIVAVPAAGDFGEKQRKLERVNVQR
jgi:hypothetical protein